MIVECLIGLFIDSQLHDIAIKTVFHHHHCYHCARINIVDVKNTSRPQKTKCKEKNIKHCSYYTITDSGCHCLRSTDTNALTVLQTNTRLGDGSFSVAGPKVWKSLPATLQQPDVEFGQFKQLLRTFLFGEAAVH